MSKEYEQYEHHGNIVWTRKDLKGKHRDHCLCHNCEKLNLVERASNCPKANLLYALCCALGMATPVFECPDFEEKSDN